MAFLQTVVSWSLCTIWFFFKQWSVTVCVHSRIAFLWLKQASAHLFSMILYIFHLVIPIFWSASPTVPQYLLCHHSLYSLIHNLIAFLALYITIFLVVYCSWCHLCRYTFGFYCLLLSLPPALYIWKKKKSRKKEMFPRTAAQMYIIIIRQYRQKLQDTIMNKIWAVVPTLTYWKTQWKRKRKKKHQKKAIWLGWARGTRK